MRDITQEQAQDLINAGLFALGYMLGKNESGRVMFWLASALKGAGSDCSYLDGIIEKEGPKKPKESV